MRSIHWKTGIGIAAMVAILFGSYYFINILTTPSIEPITVFTADTAPQHIILQKDNGEKNYVERTGDSRQSDSA